MLVNFWRGYQGIGWHQYDKDDIVHTDTVHGFGPDGNAPRRKLHARLRPQPFFGNLRSAKIFILGGNPCCIPADEETQRNEKFNEYNEMHLATLRGEVQGFAPIDRRANKTGAATYWRKRLRRIARAVYNAVHKNNPTARRLSRDQDDQPAFDAIAPFVAVIEASAYPSLNKPPVWVDDLRSSRQARRYVQEVLRPRAELGEIVVIAWRRPELWGLEPIANQIFVRNLRNTQTYPIVRDERERVIQVLTEAVTNQVVVPTPTSLVRGPSSNGTESPIEP